ncbi:MAG: EF-hand domain-containing protein [Gammaproteobacteria bacterium]
MRKEWTILAVALFSGTAMAGGTAFSKLDANHDGKISKQEAAADPALEAHFSQADTNKDGTLEQGEFAAMETAPAAGHKDSGMQQQPGAMQPHGDMQKQGGAE